MTDRSDRGFPSGPPLLERDADQTPAPVDPAIRWLCYQIDIEEVGTRDTTCLNP